MMVSACCILSEWFESVALSRTKPSENELPLICCYGKSRSNVPMLCSLKADRDVRISISLIYTNHSVVLSSCQARCLLTAPRANVCANLEDTEVYNTRLTFWSYMAIRVFVGIIGGTAFAMFEGAVMAILREQNADYGLQRVYANIGGMISSPLSGILMDYASKGKGYTDFR